MDARGSAYVAATLHALNGSLHNVSLRAGRQRSLHPRTRRKAPDDEGASSSVSSWLGANRPARSMAPRAQFIRRALTVSSCDSGYQVCAILSVFGRAAVLS